MTNQFKRRKNISACVDNSTVAVSKSKNSGNIDTSKSHDEWETPDSLFNKLNNEFEFNYDLACNSENCKCIDGSKTDIGKNGLEFNPDEYRQNKVNKKIQSKDYLTIWCNPPYNRIDKPNFIKKCFNLSQHPRVDAVVMLIPSKTSTGDFHDIILPNAEIRWLKGRPKFKGINNIGKYVTQNSGRNDCMIVIFRNLSFKIQTTLPVIQTNRAARISRYLAMQRLHYFLSPFALSANDLLSLSFAPSICISVRIISVI